MCLLTCHVYVTPEWVGKLIQADDMEGDMPNRRVQPVKAIFGSHKTRVYLRQGHFNDSPLTVCRCEDEILESRQPRSKVQGPSFKTLGPRTLAHDTRTLAHDARNLALEP